MNNVILSLGSNLGNKTNNLKTAIENLNKNKIFIEKQSYVYKTEPWHTINQDFYLNQILIVNTEYSIYKLLENILMIETQMGRIRKQKWEERIIDIDIIFYNNDIFIEDKIKVPHLLLHKRKFVLLPLIEMGFGNFIHPFLNKSINELYNNLDDKCIVEKYI